MANEAILSAGVKLTLAATGTTTSIANADFQECTDAVRLVSDSAGYPLGVFEFSTAAGGFSVAPTAGAAIHVYEQKVNSLSQDAPDVNANYEHDYLYTFNVDVADAQQRFVSPPLPINRTGGKYWVKWVDGGAGTASVDAGWSMTLTPVTYGS